MRNEQSKSHSSNRYHRLYVFNLEKNVSFPVFFLDIFLFIGYAMFRKKWGRGLFSSGNSSSPTKIVFCYEILTVICLRRGQVLKGAENESVKVNENEFFIVSDFVGWFCVHKSGYR
jgi:hypothetical protein